MLDTEVEKIVAALDWEKRWMERFTLFATSLIGDVYFFGCQEQLGVAFNRMFFVYQEGMVTCYQLISENTVFGNALARRLEADHHLVDGWNREVKDKVDEVLSLVAAYEGTLFEESHYLAFEHAFRALQPPFVRLTRVANYLAPSWHNTLLPPLNAMRLATETVYGRVDSFVQRSLRQLAGQIGRDPDLVELLYHYEVREFVKQGTLPPDAELRSRAPVSGLYFENGRQFFCDSKEVGLFQRLVADKFGSQDGIVRGVTAVPGYVKGTARIIFDPQKPGVFNDGDILVTNMTYPEFVPLMKKAGAIVTDGGGILCHAAIVARELGKPCLINTQVATSTFHDGEQVEVDATQGTIKRAA
ncbi:MAG: hypothetical protein HYV42_02880 [Candidatus Magasanikbacteria bacterium]|nr:hypothetical protein [Candidatus Magasanikbacteria bacterium]